MSLLKLLPNSILGLKGAKPASYVPKSVNRFFIGSNLDTDNTTGPKYLDNPPK
jgi:hypothetical protein